MAYIGQSLTEGTRRAYTFVATAGQTTFNAVYGVGAVDVYQNGILLQPSDYNSSSGSSVVLGVGAAVNDEITIIAHNTFSVADTLTASQGGTFTGNVQFDGSFTSKGIDDNADATAITIDSSERVLIGKTSPAFGTVGHTIYNDGSHDLTASAIPPIQANRLSSDGDIAAFFKDGASVGSIGVSSDGASFGNATQHVAMHSNKLFPATPTHSALDNTIDLGYSGSRYKDLYLSGGVYLGGTGAANKLSDYESGTYNPTIHCGSGSITLNSSYDTYAYTKIGNKVTVTGLAVPSAVSSPSGTLEITLPFASANSTEFSERSNNIVGFWLNGSGVPNGSNYYNAMLFLLQNGLSYIKVYLQGYDGSYNPNPANWIGVGSDMHINFTYFAA